MLQQKMQTLAAQVENVMVQYFSTALETTSQKTALIDATLYSLQSGGKRLRPALLLLLLESFHHNIDAGLHTAAALEMVHTYSLIHDDLPSMDNDDMRRGKPTNHKVYGEALAILAGDTLLTEAFHMIAQDTRLPEPVRLKLVSLLSTQAGFRGMILGQVIDMNTDAKALTLANLKMMHELKTGRLIQFACVAAGLIAGQNEATLASLDAYGRHLGLAFQIKDDLLDIEGDEALIGKKVGSDVANDKTTYVSLLGIDGAKEMLKDEIAAAHAMLVKLDGDMSLLYELTQFVASRET